MPDTPPLGPPLADAEVMGRALSMPTDELAGRLGAAQPRRCPLPPPGWRCTRSWPHDGPCAAEPVRDDQDDTLLAIAVLMVVLALGVMVGYVWAVV